MAKEQPSCNKCACPDCCMPLYDVPVDQVNPCEKCGASLKDEETGECVFCKTP